MTSTIKQQKDYSNLTPMAFCAMHRVSNTTGRYYTAKVTTSHNDRVPFAILIGTQYQALAPICGLAYVTNSNNVVLFNSDSATYDSSTNIITVDLGNSAYIRPIIVYPKGEVEFE